MGDITWREIIACGASLTAVVFSLKLLYSSSETLTELSPPEIGVEGLIGNTPMMKVKSLSKITGNNVYAKLEFMNPGGSAKDRVALAIIRDEERKGHLKPGDVIFEGTSGSTGISIATVANSLGYKTEIHLPDDTSPDKLALFDTLGAGLVKVKPASIVDPDQYVNSAKKAADKLNSSDSEKNGVFADQFENDSNWRVHFNTTGPEIYRQLQGKVDYFIAGCGTGGTIAGVSKYLKSKLSNVTTILADPQGSGFFNRVKYGVMYTNEEKEGTRRRHQVDTLVEGIGLNRITHNFSIGEDYIDDSIKVTDEQALQMAKFLSVNDGLFIGSSTAINAVAVVKLCKETGIKNKNIVIVACDSGTRHLQKFWKYAVEVPNEITVDDIVS
ncbi:CYK2 [Cyberlindnera jadinii]|uniref:CYK2 protein n=1 Tax=Cyberlindnera jadinii (strain ATCC 18201 / CBS 1600 / BCRC 20928 / JCM 3617 / NBRC 0987 / NRRL Y-1542) TaxID=983966 RepID=A0A0H5C6Z1_CYBJN|nr:pyridoxal phosphate-dependent enzyme, beta subunit [Cyberlindnera jadinii NRRL Y-1542]ODV71879.1 pyridoxal phosphate-dependent enzyme, beta subunit [Cyberlindnera jadinii NRRL Y-1542]CEP23823.1 CYK2 [Cyberlindnera jadinii]